MCQFGCRSSTRSCCGAPPKNMEQIEAMLREEIEYDGLSVIIPRRDDSDIEET